LQQSLVIGHWSLGFAAKVMFDEKLIGMMQK